MGKGTPTPAAVHNAAGRVPRGPVTAGASGQEIIKRLAAIEERLGTIQQQVETLDGQLGEHMADCVKHPMFPDKDPESAMRVPFAGTIGGAAAADKPILEIVAKADVEAMAKDTHEKWLASAPRAYSPFNMDWEALSYEQKQQISRQSRNVVDMLVAANPHVTFEIHDPWAS